MGEITGKIKDISYVGIADVVSKGIAAFFWFYIASVLEPSSYGEITYIFSIAGVSSAVSLLGSSNTITIYTAKKIQIESTLYFLTLIAGTISSIVLFFIFLDFGLSFLNMGILIFSLLTAEILGMQLYQNYAKVIILQKLLMVFLGISFYYFFGEDGIVTGIAMSYFPFIYFIIKTFLRVKISFSMLSNRSHFLINNYIQTLSGAFSSSLDKLIIAPLFGFALLGNYALGLQFLVILVLLPEVVRKYLMAQESKGVVNKKLKTILIITSILLAFLGIIAGPPVMSYFFPKFIEAQDVIRIVSLSVIPTTIMMIYHTKFLGMEQGKHVLITSLSRTISQLIFIVILGSMYGVNGIAASLVIASTISAIYAYLANQKFIK